MTTNANANGLVGLTANLANPVVAIGTTQGATGTVKTTNSISYAIDGQVYTKAATDNIAVTAAITAQASAVQGLLTTCLYLIQLDSSGNATMVKGKEILTADLTNGNKVLEWPQPTDGRCPIGAFRVALASTATFTFGVTALNATNVTTTYYNLSVVPSAPLTS